MIAALWVLASRLTYLSVKIATWKSACTIGGLPFRLQRTELVLLPDHGSDAWSLSSSRMGAAINSSQLPSESVDIRRYADSAPRPAMGLLLFRSDKNFIEITSVQAAPITRPPAWVIDRQEFNR